MTKGRRLSGPWLGSARAGCTILAAAALLLCSSAGHAFKQKGGNCAACHRLTKEEVAPILQKLRAPEATIADMRMSPVKGLWEVSAVNRGRPLVFYLDFSKTYVMAGPLFDKRTGADMTRQRLAEMERAKRVDVKGIALEDALVIGNQVAANRVIVFTDPG